MWTPALLAYALGLFLTGLVLFRTQIFKNNHLMNVGSVVLWPVYWTVYLVAVFQSRRGR